MEYARSPSGKLDISDCFSDHVVDNIRIMNDFCVDRLHHSSPTHQADGPEIHIDAVEKIGANNSSFLSLEKRRGNPDPL
jgi:hypothetical protein